jgi:hypothetical protein
MFDWSSSKILSVYAFAARSSRLWFVDSIGTDLVAVRLACLRKQDQRRCVRGLE